jgi:hypothetical protein
MSKCIKPEQSVTGTYFKVQSQIPWKIGVKQTSVNRRKQILTGDGEAYYSRAFLRPLESSVSPRFFSWRPIAD